MTQTAPNRFRSVADQKQRLAPLEPTNVLQLPGNPAIDMVANEGAFVFGSRLAPPSVATQSFQNLLYHVALAMVRRRNVGEDEELSHAQLWLNTHLAL